MLSGLQYGCPSLTNQDSWHFTPSECLLAYDPQFPHLKGRSSHLCPATYKVNRDGWEGAFKQEK